MKPLKLVFRLATPVVEPEYPIHLDAVLAYAAVTAADGDLNAQESLPLAKETNGQDWVWRASALRFDNGLTQIRYFTRKTDVEEIAEWQGDMIRNRGDKVSLASGPFKNYFMFFPVRHASQAVAYCMGDKEGIAKLLQKITNLGKRTRLGFGKITSIEITEDVAAEQNWQARVIPWEPKEKSSYTKAICGYKPPYWSIENRKMCWIHNEL